MSSVQTPRPAPSRRSLYLRTTAFFVPIILVAAHLNVGQTCCSDSCPSLNFVVSKDSNGVSAEGYQASVSDSGTFITFTSRKLGCSAESCIFLHDLATETTEEIPMLSSDSEAAYYSALSGNGRFVAFTERVSLDPLEVALRYFDRETGETETLASFDDLDTTRVAVSEDGNLIAFDTNTRLVGSDVDDDQDVYLFDRRDRSLRIAENHLTTSGRPALSSDGNWLVSEAWNVAEDTSILTRTDGTGTPFLLPARWASINADGTLVAYSRYESSIGSSRIYVFDRLTNTHELVSLDSLGHPPPSTNAWCEFPILSGDGRFVAFTCNAPLTPHGADNQVYVRDLEFGTTHLASVSPDGAPANSHSWPTAMSYDHALIFHSYADNLGPVSSERQYPTVYRVPFSYWDAGCVPTGADETTCDGVDDDCDGAADEDFAAYATTCGFASCVASGIMDCVDGQLTDSCVPGTPPAATDSICDGVDQDCDGLTDEDFSSQLTNCGLGICAASGATSCVGGTEQDSCVPGNPIPGLDVCSGADEDCDGVVDEDFIQVPTTCGVGACASTGFVTCFDGVEFDTCSASSPSANDVTCDGIDNDCDGQVDEDCCQLPATCQDYNIDCGTIDDGCGGTLNCGSCQGGETCGGGGIANVCGRPPPPDPVTVAPQGPVGTGSPYASYAFLVEGPDPVQTGVEVGAIEPHRTGVLRGRVLTTAGDPLPSVKVTVIDEPSLGQTYSRTDGHYDMVVNGGGSVTVELEAVGYLPVQRKVRVDWGGFAKVPDVVMVVQSDVATPLTFGSAQPQVAVSRPVADEDGVRQVVGYIPSGVNATAEANGQSVPIWQATIRMTEYTVGPSGPLAMPAQLPENSAYTFAVDLSLDEFGPEARVVFSDTTYFYVDNFLDLPVGAVVPNGYYNYELAAWVPEPDGLVMRVVGLDPDGRALLDATHDEPDDQGAEDLGELALLGVTDEEREAIANQYPVGASFWRMPIDHLSPYDWNLSGFLREPPPPDEPPAEDLPTPCPPDVVNASILYCQSRSLAEEIPIAGTTHFLRYDSDRAKANVIRGRTAVIQFPEPPETAIAFRFTARVLGKTIVDDLELPLDTESYVVEWDGLDAYGRPWRGAANLEYLLSYRFQPRFQMALARQIRVADAEASFGRAICTRGTPCCVGGTGVIALRVGRTVTESQLAFTKRVPLGVDVGGALGFGGWTLSDHHLYDVTSSTLLRGDGSSYRAGAARGRARVIAGRASDGLAANDIETTASSFNDITSPSHLAVGPDGSVFFAAAPHTIWRLRRNGALEEVPLGNSGVSCSSIYDIALDSGGDLYVVCYNPSNRVIRLVERSDGTWWGELLIGGTDFSGDVWRDGEPLRDTNIAPRSIAFREDGTMFVSVAQHAGGHPLIYGDNPERPLELVEVLPDGRGRIVDVAESDGLGNSVAVHVGSRIARSANNTLVALTTDYRVVRIHPSNAATTLMNATGTPVGFDWESTETHYGGYSTRLGDIASSAEGDVYVTYSPHSCQIHPLIHISPRGEIRRTSMVGLPQDFNFGTSPCISAAREGSGGALPRYVTVDSNGVVHVADTSHHRIYALASHLAVDVDAFQVVAEDGSEIYHFAFDGLHKYTEDAQTGAELFRFEHDEEGRLTEISNRDGRVTEINRPDDSTIEIIAPPGPDQPDGTAGQSATTVLKMDENGNLEQVQDPRGALWAMDYYAPDDQFPGGGVLSRLWDPRANAEGLRVGQPSVFEYEPFRRDLTGPAQANARFIVKKDTDAVGGVHELSSSLDPPDIEPIHGVWCDGREYVKGYRIRKTTGRVTRTTGQQRKTEYVTEAKNGYSTPGLTLLRHHGQRITTTRTEPTGWTVTRHGPDQENVASLSWPGGSSLTTMTSHPRLGMDVLVPETSTLEFGAVSGTYGRPALRQDTVHTWESDFGVSSGFSTPDVETVTTSITSASTEASRTSTAVYDQATRTVTTTSPEGRTSRYTLDSKSRINGVELPGQVPTLYVYDPDGYLKVVGRQDGAMLRRAEFGYDVRGYVNSVKKRVSDTVTDQVFLTNDPMGFTTQAQVPGVLTVGSDPDIQGALSVLTPDGKPPHQLAHTATGELAQYASPAGTITSDGVCALGTQCWQYSSDGDVEGITLADGSFVDYVYHPSQGTLTSVDVPGHGTTSFTYDLGRRVRATFPGGGSMDFAWQSTLPIATSWDVPIWVPDPNDSEPPAWAGDIDGIVERVYNDFTEVSEIRVAGGASIRILRDNDGLVTTIEDAVAAPSIPTLTLTRSPIDGHIEATTVGVVDTTQLFDISESNPGFGDLTSINAAISGTVTYGGNYLYDDRGRVDTWTETMHGTTSGRKFEYDAAGRLIKVRDENDNLIEEYAYDGNGNRTKAISTNLDAELGVNLGCTDGSTTTAANEEDQLCRYGDFEYRYNDRGQLEERERVIGGAIAQFEYDGLGRLHRVVTEQGRRIRYFHDALGRRIGKVVDERLEKGWLYLDALNPIAQLDHNGSVEATFVYGSRAHVPDMMAMADGTVYRFITDHLGSVRLVVNVADGTVVQRLGYDSFGRVLVDTNPGFQPFGFAGGLYDPDTGLVRFGARDYDAYAGRWTAKDPLIFEGLQPNLYQYVAGDPVNLIDPTGEIVWFVFAAGAAIGAVAQLWANYDAFKCGQISREDFLTSVAAGALTGALASLPAGLLASALAGAGGAAVNELVNGAIGAKDAGLSEFATATTLGGLGGFTAAGGAKLGSNVLRGRDRVIGRHLPLPPRQTYEVPGGVAGSAFGTVVAGELDN